MPFVDSGSVADPDSRSALGLTLGSGIRIGLYSRSRTGSELIYSKDRIGNFLGKKN